MLHHSYLYCKVYKCIKRLDAVLLMDSALLYYFHFLWTKTINRKKTHKTFCSVYINVMSSPDRWNNTKNKHFVKWYMRKPIEIEHFDGYALHWSWTVFFCYCEEYLLTKFNTQRNMMPKTLVKCVHRKIVSVKVESSVIEISESVQWSRRCYAII